MDERFSSFFPTSYKRSVTYTLAVAGAFDLRTATETMIPMATNVIPNELMI